MLNLTRPPRLMAGAIMLSFAAAMGPATAASEDEDVVVGTVGIAVSMDPLFAIDTGSQDYSHNVFETLIEYDADLNIQPLLAVSWNQVDAKTWEFELRKGVKFHDGTELRAADAVASLKRASKEVPGSSSPITNYFAEVADIVATSDYTFRVIGKEPIPLFPYSMSWVAITPAHVAQRANNDDFNSGELAIGTGPFKLDSFTPNNSIKLSRNDNYWAGPLPWAHVTFKLIKNPGARVAALLAGDVDLINIVPPQDVPRLRHESSIALHEKVTDRLIYILMDQHREITPHVKAKDGTQIKNPFLDPKVRKALAYAIDEGVLVDKVMRGIAKEANQPMVEGMPGFAPDLPQNISDVEKAHALLAEAGYPDGFSVTLNGPDGRYTNDAQVTQAVAQMLSRLGLDVRVESLPRQIFASRGNKLEYSLALYGFSLASGAEMLQYLVHTRDKAHGWGGSNRGRYSNLEVDRLTEELFASADAKKRDEIVAAASRVVMTDQGVIPLYHQVAVWATRADLEFDGRIDEKTLLRGLRKKQP